MSFTLENWNALIRTTLLPSNNDLLALSNESIAILVKVTKDEEDRVRTLFLEGMLQRKKVKDKQQFVKLNQAMLIRLLDKLSFYRKTIDLDNKILKLYEAVSSRLESMLYFIEDFFGNYFDRNEKVPACYLEGSIQELCRQVESLEECIQPRPPYINAVGNILATNFRKFCIEKKDKATYNELIYQKELMKNLLADDTLSAEDSINKVLFYFNYNDDEYVAYLYEKFVLLTQSLDTKNEKISALRYEQKKCNQLQVRLDVSLSLVLPSLSKQVNQWLEEEIKFLEIDNIPKPVKAAAIPAVTEKSYFLVPFKGTEIHLLLKSFIDSGGAPVETYKSLFEKAGAYLSNKNQKGFSTESLQKASDKINYAAKENVKRFLQKMMRNIDSY
jgi:hypothetical protein